ncbi:MAG: glycerol kinase GlpK [Lentisphaeria bacterium]|nr:glycerol kinase GlpK [Lentisphaeria bacterium]
MVGQYILALDQGTTSSRAILFDHDQCVVGTAQREFRQIYPRAGWVEHDPMDIWTSQRTVMEEVLARSGVAPEQLAGLGITNQRETTIVWERATGRPVHNAIVWQCRRTADICERLEKDGMGAHIRASTGLVLDAYFSGTKINWILDHVDGARAQAERGELLFGTIDTWLIWQLTGGEVHVTDCTNASRTMLFNIRTLDWDDDILRALAIPRSMLPDVRSSSEIYGHARMGDSGFPVPIAGVAGDQQAALFGQGCHQPGMVKNTYGTGCFMLMNTGARMIQSQNGLLATIAIGVEGKVEYALEGSVFAGGAAVQWLRDELEIIDTAADSENAAESVSDSNGVYVVPAFAGLGSPYWDMYARGAILGLTRGANRNHIIRATLESIAYQSRDLLEAMMADSGVDIEVLDVDGGAVANNFLMQFQADILGKQVRRPVITETTALGAACLAGLATGFWKDRATIASARRIECVFEPTLDEEHRDAAYAGWKKAVQRSLNWIDPGD